MLLLSLSSRSPPYLSDIRIPSSSLLGSKSAIKMLHHQPLFPVVLSSPPNSTPSTPPVPGSLIPSPTPPISDPPSPIHPSTNTHHFTTFAQAGETLEDGGKEGGELILGAQEVLEASSSREARTRWEDSSSGRWVSQRSILISLSLLLPQLPLLRIPRSSRFTLR